MKVCVFTGTRAEYGLLRPVLDRLREHDEVALQLLASGTHLSRRHGHTVDEIIKDGFTVDATVPLSLEDDSPRGVCADFGLAVTGIGNALDSLAPDVLVLLGDRYEGLACATAAVIMGVPVAHIHGGEITEGALDDYFRHAMTKLSRLHFTSTEEYRSRVIQLGEFPDRVWNVGALGVENAKTAPLLNQTELRTRLDFEVDGRTLLCTYHPVTAGSDATAQTKAFFAGLRHALEQNPALTAIITGANADAGNRLVDRKARELAADFKGRMLVSPSLGMVSYLSAMKHCAAVVGNSSSGIIEAPSMGVPTVDFGDRQRGRARSASVLHCPPENGELARAIAQALSEEHRSLAKTAGNPYEKTGTSESIVTRLVGFRETGSKGFHDITQHTGGLP